MGYEAPCTVRFEGKTARGTARLEHKDLVFRGPIRLAIPLKEIDQAQADKGTLHIRFRGTAAELDVGTAAAKWAERIVNPPSRLDKLGVKPGQAIAVLGVDDDELIREMKLRGAAVATRPAAEGAADLVFYAANRRADLARLSALAKTIKPEGAIWIVRPKGQSAITEADSMAGGKAAGLVDVKVVSFSDTHTAEKFVIPVKARPRAAASSTGARVTPAGARAESSRSSSPSPRTRGSAASRGRR